jgi:hypothetical protein
MDLPVAQRAMSVVAALLLVLALGFELWPVSVTIIGDASYSCGSGLDHSQHTWKLDSQGLSSGPVAVGSSSATPTSACPSAIYGHRDLGIALGAFAILAGFAAWALGTPFDPSVRRKTRHARTHKPHPLH